MANRADPDQLAFQKPSDLDLHCLQWQVISGFSRTRINRILLSDIRDFSGLCSVLNCASN